MCDFGILVTATDGFKMDLSSPDYNSFCGFNYIPCKANITIHQISSKN